MTVNDIAYGRVSDQALVVQEVCMTLAQAILDLQDDVNSILDKLQDVRFHED